MAKGETTPVKTSATSLRHLGLSSRHPELVSGSSSSPSWFKIVVLAVGLLILAAIGFWIWQQFSGGAAAGPKLQVAGTQIDKTIVKADGADSAAVKITVLRDTQPAAGVWVGLKVKDPSQVTDQFDYFGWYAPEPSRTFYPTDESGAVTFLVKSKVAGEINYEIYAADPASKSRDQYLDLGFSFPLKFQ